MKSSLPKFITLLVVLAAPHRASTAEPVLVWRLETPNAVGGQKPLVIGKPRAVVEDGRKAVRFDGAGDGLIFDTNPLADWKTFTVEVLFKPDGDGPPAQRFVHFEDIAENRALIETRVTPEKQWYLDTFLYVRAKDDGVTLADKRLLHPCDRWFWAALVYDGKTMSHYVDGMRELDGGIALGPLGKGRMSVGVRLNRVYWFKGAIAELRFQARALSATELQRPKL